MKRIEVLDYLRFFAAICVVMFHYLYSGIVLTNKITSLNELSSLAAWAKYGYLGVDLFFIISGYVICFSAKSGLPDKFLVSRAVRLYPAFIAAVIFTTIFSLFLGGEKMSVSGAQFLANFTMVPGLFGQKAVDGVYWTLLYEIKFYALVFVFLLFGLTRYLDTFFKAWPFLILLALITGFSEITYFGQYYYYFSAGALFALLKDKKELITLLGIFICYSLSVYFSLEKTAEMEFEYGVVFSKITIILIITFMYLMFFISDNKYISSIKLPYSMAIGALTYPVYLIHAHFGYMVISRFSNEDNKWWVYIVLITVVLIISWLINYFIEQRLSSMWKKLFTMTLGALAQNINHWVYSTSSKLLNKSV